MISHIQSVDVTYHGHKVGTLSMADKYVCAFEYDADWLKHGFAISPLQLPLKSGLFKASWQPFSGNFGIFEDSLPGGYSEYLLRKVLAKQGIDYAALTPVQRLSLVGSSGMGALCYAPATHINTGTTQGSESLDALQDMALRVLSEKTDSYADLLYFKSGNSGGVRPKCLYTDEEGGHWIIKFRHIYDSQHIGQIEYLYNRAAAACGIEVPEFKLCQDKYFAERRFDLIGRKRLHTATAAALLNEPISPPKMDYHSLLQLTGFLTQSAEAVEQQFRRMAFNVYAKNYDDHARNFSFIYTGGGWKLAPAYDLTNDQALGEHATTVNYHGLPTDEDMLVVGSNAHIPRARCLQIMDEVRPIATAVLNEIC